MWSVRVYFRRRGLETQNLKNQSDNGSARYTSFASVFEEKEKEGEENMKVHCMMMCSKLTLVHRLYRLPYFGFERTEPEEGASHCFVFLSQTQNSNLTLKSVSQWN